MENHSKTVNVGGGNNQQNSNATAPEIKTNTPQPQNNSYATPAIQQNKNVNDNQPFMIDDEFPMLTEDLTLPSLGKLYPTGQKTATVKFLTTSEENILFDSNLIKNGTVLSVLLNHTVIKSETSPDDMLVGDRNYLLTQIRKLSFGELYENVKITCPKCGAENKYDIDLNKLTVKSLESEPDDMGEYSVELPKTKINIKFRFLNGKDEIVLSKIQERAIKTKKGTVVPNLSERYLLQIMDVNGNRDKGYIKKFIQSLNIFDSRFFREYYAQLEPGQDLSYVFECKEEDCMHEFTGDIPINSNFFWPTSKLED